MTVLSESGRGSRASGVADASFVTGRQCLAWGCLIGALCLLVYGVATTLQPYYLQWGQYCTASEFYPSDYIVRFLRDQAGQPGCVWYHLIGSATERPLFLLLAAPLTRAVAVAALIAFIQRVYGSGLVAVLAAAWLVVRFGLWPAINSLGVTETLMFSPRAVAGAQIILALALVTSSRHVAAALVFASGLYTQAFNTGNAVVVSLMFMAITGFTVADRRRYLTGVAAFVAVLVVCGLPYAAGAIGGPTLPPGFVREWTTMRFLSEPDDASLLFTFSWVGPEWWALHALGALALVYVLGSGVRTWLGHPAARWVISVWLVLAAAALCEWLYLQLPEPLLFPLRFEVRRIVWLPGLLMVGAIVAAIGKAASAESPVVRYAGHAAIVVALALPFIRFYPSTLGILLALIVPVAALVEWTPMIRRRSAACFAGMAAVLAAAHVLPMLAAALPIAGSSVGPAARTITRSLPGLVGTTALAAAAAFGPALAARLIGAGRRRLTAALALYIVALFAWPGITTPEGMMGSWTRLAPLASAHRLSLAEWAVFTRSHDARISELIASDQYALSLDMETAAVAAGELTAVDAVLLVPPGSSNVRGLSRRNVFLLEDEDNAMSHYGPRVWMEFRARFRDALGWDYLDYAARRSGPRPSLDELYGALTPERIRSLAQQYGVTHALTQRDHPLPFPEIYRNRTYALYAIPPAR